MPIIGKNTYEVENNVLLCDKTYESLTLLYQPLVGANAISIYLTFNKMENHTDYSFLCLYTGLSIESIEHSIIMLERYRLIKTYKNEKEDKFIHVVLEP